MDFIEFHPSMSLSNISIMDSHLPPPAPTNMTSTVGSKGVKMEDVLSKRYETWNKTSRVGL
jgi:hypothetical protein